MPANNIGIVGTGPMGSNLSLNIESKGYTVSVYDISRQSIDDFMSARAKNKKIHPYYDIREFIDSLEPPKKILLMIKAGKPVDETIERLIPLLGKGDLIIDGGNSYFKDTVRRENCLGSKGILFIGTGISGGEEGALKGPAIMPGGKADAYSLVKDLFEKISAKAPDGFPCVSHIGPDGAGHFVKMVHNGIEYGDMALIGECVWALKTVLGLDASDISGIMRQWNNKNDILSSYLIEITAESLAQKESTGQDYLVDSIADITRMKGTGTWAVQSALELLVSVPTIASAVFSREASQDKDLRLSLSENLEYPSKKYSGNREEFISIAHDALYIAKISSYAQGFALLEAASKSYGWNLDMGRIASGWRAGCIIRAQFLSEITTQYDKNPDIVNLISAPVFKDFINKNIEKFSKFIEISHSAGLPVSCTSSSFDYILQITSHVLVSAQVQALQRDYFGAHGYFKLKKDSPEIKSDSNGKYIEYHTDWMDKKRPEKLV